MHSYDWLVFMTVGLDTYYNPVIITNISIETPIFSIFCSVRLFEWGLNNFFDVDSVNRKVAASSGSILI